MVGFQSIWSVHICLFYSICFVSFNYFVSQWLVFRFRRVLGLSAMATLGLICMDACNYSFVVGNCPCTCVNPSKIYTLITLRIGCLHGNVTACTFQNLFLLLCITCAWRSLTIPLPVIIRAPDLLRLYSFCRVALCIHYIRCVVLNHVSYFMVC
jgi:hypothetical protein